MPNTTNANAYEFTTAEVRGIVKDYNNGTGMRAIAEEWGVSSAVIRRVLVEAGATIRGRGRPSNAA